MAEETNSHEGERERQPGGVITNKKFVFYLCSSCNSCILLHNAFLSVLIWNWNYLPSSKIGLTLQTCSIVTLQVECSWCMAVTLRAQSPPYSREITWCNGTRPQLDFEILFFKSLVNFLCHFPPKTTPIPSKPKLTSIPFYTLLLFWPE